MTSIESIVEWVNQKGKPLWWRHAIRLALQNRELTIPDVQSLGDIAKMEHGLIQADEFYLANIEPVEAIGYEQEEDSVRLLGVGRVQNVSALVSDQELTFSPEGITVVYGDNGSGKTSYAKILKSACLTRGDAPEILTNVFNPSSARSEAAIKIRVGEHEPTKFQWQNGAPAIPELKSIRVFDSLSSKNYISKEDSIEFKPASIKLLDELTTACIEIKNVTTIELGNHSLSFVLANMSNSSDASKFINKISANTKHELVDAHCAKPEENARLLVLKDELHELSGRSPEQLRKLFAEKQKHIEPLRDYIQNLCENLSDERLTQISKYYDDMQSKFNAAEKIRRLTFNDLPIDGVGASSWQLMWQHVENFIKNNDQGASFPPVEGDTCPTCLQPVSQVAATRLSLFQNYLNDKSQREANKANSVYNKSIEKIKIIQFDLSPYNGIIQELRNSKPEVIAGLDSLLIQLSYRLNSILSDQPSFKQNPLTLRVPIWLNAQVDSCIENIKTFKDNASLSTLIIEKQQAINEIEDRQNIANYRKQILNEISRLSYIEKLNRIISSAQLTPITRLGSKLGSVDSLGDLNNQFNIELKTLGFKTFPVTAKTRGSAGQQKFKLLLLDNPTKIDQIASEGEQKCIALAGFLSELCVDNRKSAIIFDDPVSSLDHKWRRLFANRIALEAKTRQVIVLTHDLPFLMLLKEAADDNLTVRSIKRKGNLSGYPNTSLPWDILSTAGRIETLRQLTLDLRKYCNSSEFDEEAYKEKAKSIYGKKRTTWENLVEEWLIRNVVKRFSTDVRTSNVRYLADNTEQDVKTITEAVSKCSTYFEGHNRAQALGVPDIPEIDELENDINELREYFKQLKTRRAIQDKKK